MLVGVAFQRAVAEVAQIAVFGGQHEPQADARERGHVRLTRQFEAQRHTAVAGHAPGHAAVHQQVDGLRAQMHLRFEGDGRIAQLALGAHAARNGVAILMILPDVTHVTVVIRRRAEEVEGHGLFQKRLSVVLHLREQTGHRVVAIAEAFARNGHITLLQALDGNGLFRALLRDVAAFRPADLLEAKLMAALRPRGIDGLNHAQHAHAARARRHGNRAEGARRDVQRVRFNAHGLFRLSAAGKRAFKRDQPPGGDEIKLILQRDFAGSQIGAGDAQRAQHVLILQQARMRRTVGRDKAVGAEVAVMQRFAKIAAVAVHFASRGVHADAGRVVAPFPDKAAAHARFPFEFLEIRLQVSGAVAHGKDVRLADGVLLEIFANFLNGRVHAAVRIQIGPVDFHPRRREGRALVMRQAGRIVPLRPGERLVKVHAVAGFVAHRIDHHAREVLIAQHHAPHAIEHRAFKRRIVGDAVIGLAAVVAAEERHNAVRFLIRLVQHVNAQLLAQLVEIRRLRIVAGAHGVDVVALHNRHVAQNMLARRIRAGIAAALMHVHAAETNGFAVEQHDLVAHLDFAHAHAARDGFLSAGEDQRVQFGRFRRPQRRRVQRKLASAALGFLAGDARPVGREQFARAFAAGCGEFRVKANDGLRKIVVQLGMDVEIDHMLRFAPHKVHVAENAGPAEFVLILKIAAEAPFQHERAQRVFARAKRVRHIELRRGMRNLAGSDESAVHPQKQAAVHAFEDELIDRIGLLFQRQRAAIQPARVFRRHKRRIVREGIAHVGILNGVVAVQLHHAGHGHRLFKRDGHGIELAGQIAHAVIIRKIPLAVEERKAFAFLARGAGVLSFFKRNEIRMRRVFARVHHPHVHIFVILFQSHRIKPPM